jgi:lipoprotein NlpI/RsiW-degrading membrane proteinase PrsW (M82 family)
MSATLASPFFVLPATLLSGLLLAWMIARLGQGEFPLALFRAAVSLGVVMGLLILLAEAPFDLPANVRVFSPLLSAFGFAGFPEEGVKFAAVFFFLRPHYLARTHRSLVLAAAAVGLGFALTEDVLYIAKAGPEWGAIAAGRALSAVPVHVFLASIAGFAIARSAFSATPARAVARIAAAYVAASLLHGLYDLPQFILNAKPPYPKIIEDLADRLGVSQPALLHGVVVSAALCIAWAGFRRFRAIGRRPFPPPRALSTALRRGWFMRLLLARATGWVVSGVLLLGSLTAIALLAAASFLTSQLDPLIEGAIFVVFPVAIALTLLLAQPARAGRGIVASPAPIWRRPRWALAAAIVAVVLAAGYHWGEKPAREAVAIRITVQGLQLAVNGDQEGAIREYDRALGFDPDFVDALAKRAASNSILQHYDRAKVDLDHALGLQPQNVVLLLQRAALERDMHAEAGALADLDHALELRPNNPGILATRAQVESDAGENAKAADDIARAVALDPHQAEALDAQAMLFVKSGDYDRAQKVLDEELQAHPGDADALFARGRLRFYQQNVAGAVDDLARASAVSSFPYAAMWLFLARARMGIDGRQDFVAHTRRWPHETWPSPVIQHLLGNISATEARADAANDDQRCEADFYNGELLLGRGERAPALAAFHLAVSECPAGFVEYEGALAELRRLDRPAPTPPPEAKSSQAASPASGDGSNSAAGETPAIEKEVASGAAAATVTHASAYFSGNAVWSFIDRGAAGGELVAVLLFASPSIHGEFSLKRTLIGGEPKYELLFKILASDRLALPYSALGAGLAMPLIDVNGQRAPLFAPSEFLRVDDTTYRMSLPADGVASALSRLAAGTRLSLELAPYGCKCMPLSFTLDRHTAPVFQAAASAWR